MDLTALLQQIIRLNLQQRADAGVLVTKMPNHPCLLRVAPDDEKKL
jgi:hypothetical protein